MRQHIHHMFLYIWIVAYDLMHMQLVALIDLLKAAVVVRLEEDHSHFGISTNSWLMSKHLACRQDV